MSRINQQHVNRPTIPNPKKDSLYYSVNRQLICSTTTKYPDSNNRSSVMHEKNSRQNGNNAASVEVGKGCISKMQFTNGIDMRGKMSSIDI